MMNFKAEEREAYEEYLKWLRVEASTLRKYETKGFAEGMEKGEQIGDDKSARKVVRELFKNV